MTEDTPKKMINLEGENSKYPLPASRLLSRKNGMLKKTTDEMIFEGLDTVLEKQNLINLPHFRKVI